MPNLAYIGKIIDLKKITGADRIVAAKVVCGQGGAWQCVVPVTSQVDQLVTVFMPDALVPERPELEFMRQRKWRVTMSRFKGAPSEALAIDSLPILHDVGYDVTDELGVKKFEKPIPLSLGGDILGNFPDDLLPRTDEFRYQAVPEMVAYMQGREYMATMKMDGTSVTLINDGTVRVCSRNFEMKRTEGSALWNVVDKFNLGNLLPLNYALQFELCGPKIQANRMKYPEHMPLIFNGYELESRRYLNPKELRDLTSAMGVEYLLVPVVKVGVFEFMNDELQALADSVKYGTEPGEGIVIRPYEEAAIPIEREVRPQRVSFKVINLNYKD